MIGRKGLLRIAVVYDIPVANNLATADFMLHSEYMSGTYDRRVEISTELSRTESKKMKE